jgi:hypothetical protein
MAKPISYSQKSAQPAGPFAFGGGAVTARPRKRLLGRAILPIMLACVLLAVACVLFIPILVGGAFSSQNSLNAVGEQETVVAYNSPAQAMQALAITPAFPAALPDGMRLTACRTVNGRVLEMEYQTDRQTLLFRVAAGNEDLSGVDYDTMAFTATEETSGVTRGYAGLSEKKLMCAVWADGGYTYAVVAKNGADAALVRQFSESVA